MGEGRPRDINAHGMMVGEYGPFADAVIWFPDGTRLEFPYEDDLDNPAEAPRASQSLPC
jgi:hypothetical protein